jgi:hypothetical protein
MAEKRGFSEKVFHGVNAMPDTSDADILKRAKLDMIEPGKRKPFTLDWRFAPGPDSEFVSLAPGDFCLLRESECHFFLEEFRDIGGVVYPVDATDLEKATAVVDGMRRAMKHFNDQGSVRLVDLRKKHGLTKEEMEDFKYDHWAYYYNQARADVLKDAVAKQVKRIAALKAEGVTEDAESEESVE